MDLQRPARAALPNTVQELIAPVAADRLMRRLVEFEREDQKLAGARRCDHSQHPVIGKDALHIARYSTHQVLD